MTRQSRRHVAGTVFLVAGLAIAAAGFVVVPHPGAAESHHTVEQTTEDEVPERFDVTLFDELSSEAKTAFERALTNDGRHTAYGDANRPPEWRYTDNAGYYYVRYEGSVYEVVTFGGSSAFFDYVIVSLFLVPGLVMAGVGVRWRRRGSRSGA